MKYSPLGEIKKIRNTASLDVCYANNNPFRILINERDGGLTAYYFSCPVYSERDKRLIKLQFERVSDGHMFYGINSLIHVKYRDITLTNPHGTITCDLMRPRVFKQGSLDFMGGERECLMSDDLILFPTLNGLLFLQKSGTNANAVTLRTHEVFSDINDNAVSVSFMREEHLPYAVVSAFGSLDGGKLRPLFCETDSGETTHRISFASKERKETDAVVFSIDLYSHKTVFDTTVESRNTDKNNAYGSVAYIGNSEEFGCQWLYSRMDVMQFIDLNSMLVESARLYAPIYGEAINEIETAKMTQPWCSLGSTWNEKVEPSERLNTAESRNGHLSADITEIVRDILRMNEPKNLGIVLRPENEAGKPTTVSTGDNYFAPQIIEIKLRRNL